MAEKERREERRDPNISFRETQLLRVKNEK